jgi:hypothetical protein
MHLDPRVVSVPSNKIKDARKRKSGAGAALVTFRRLAVPRRQVASSSCCCCGRNGRATE